MRIQDVTAGHNKPSGIETPVTVEITLTSTVLLSGDNRKEISPRCSISFQYRNYPSSINRSSHVHKIGTKVTTFSGSTFHWFSGEDGQEKSRIPRAPGGFNVELVAGLFSLPSGVSDAAGVCLPSWTARFSVSRTGSSYETSAGAWR